MSSLLNRLRDQAGASLVEYALIASLIAIPSAATLSAISTTMNEEFNSIESSSSSSSSATSTTAAPPTTSGGGSPATTTTTTTVAPPASSTTTTTTTTTTTVPPTTSTTAPPPPTTTTLPGAPAFQSETVDTAGGWFEFELEDGEINLVDYDLARRWRGELTRNPDGSLTVHIWHRWNGNEIWIHAYIDSNGYLIVTVS